MTVGSTVILSMTFYNPFTDGLHMPPEDAGLQAYREVFGTDWKK